MLIIKLAIAMVVGWALYAVQPLIAAEQLRRALEHDDRVAVARLIDFPALRRSLKEAHAAEASAPPIGRDRFGQPRRDGGVFRLGGTLGTLIVHRMIDANVTPAGLPRLLASGFGGGGGGAVTTPARAAAPTLPGGAESRARRLAAMTILKAGFSGFTRFEIETIDPARMGLSTIARFELGQAGWRLTGVSFRRLSETELPTS